MKAGRKGNFQFESGASVPTKSYRVPEFVPTALLDAIFKKLVTLYESNPNSSIASLFKLVFIKSDRPNPTPGSLKILLAKEDLETANARVLGFIAYKLGKQEKPTEPKGESIGQTRQILLDMLESI
jgi:hypothetical protein